MCVDCSTGLGTNECDTCHDFTTGPSSGECSCANARDSKLERCFDCPGECSTCETDNSPYNDVVAYCSACAASAYDISNDAGYAFCVSECPTQFTAGTGDCSKDMDLVLSYFFNVPVTTYANVAAAADALDITATGGNPAIHRGYAILNNAANIPIPTLKLNHSWSIHSWIMIWTLHGGSDVNTVFSKDRRSYTPTPPEYKNSENLLRCGVDATGYLTVEWARDKGHEFKKIQLDTTIPELAWRYVVYSFENVVDTSSDPKTQYTIVQGSQAGSNSSMSQGSPQNVYNYFMNDKTDYHAFIGNSRASASPDTWEQNLQGFIYDFHIYQVTYLLGSGNDQYGTGLGCFDGSSNNQCWTVNYDTWSNTLGIAPEINCDGSCDTRGCRDANTCVADCTSDGGIEHCNLCHDQGMCINCPTYDDTCALCIPGYVAEPSGCNPCFGDCKRCGASTTTDYSDCTECMDTKWGQEFNNGASTFCTDYCPTGFTDAQPLCTAPAGPIATWTFTSTAGLTSNGLTVTPHNTIVSPARGFYLNNTSAYVDVGVVRLSINFTVSSWVFLKANLAAHQMLFQKFNWDWDALGIRPHYVRIYVNHTTGLVELNIRYNDDGERQRTADVFPVEQWEYWAFSVRLNADALTNDIRFITSKSNSQETFTGT